MFRKLLLLTILLFAVAGFAQKSFIITHDDPFSNPNLAPRPDTLTTYAVQPDGSLLLIGSFPTGTNGGAGSGDAKGGGVSSIPMRKIAISGDNKFVYASAAPMNSISAFSIDPGTGLLTLVPGSPFKTGTEACNGMGLAASPNGKALYAASACGFVAPVPGGDPMVSAFSIGPDGSLTKIGADLPIPLLSPDAAQISSKNERESYEEQFAKFPLDPLFKPIDGVRPRLWAAKRSNASASLLVQFSPCESTNLFRIR